MYVVWRMDGNFEWNKNEWDAGKKTSGNAGWLECRQALTQAGMQAGRNSGRNVGRCRQAALTNQPTNYPKILKWINGKCKQTTIIVVFDFHW